jgi:putative phage-type endonuclease
VTAVELLPPGTGNHDEQWHQLRREGVTASEIAVVMGISPYDSPFSLYWAKANDWRWDGNDLTSAGSHLEAAIADWWMAACDPLENLVMRPAGLYAHRDRPWQLATPDRLLYLPCDSCDGAGGFGMDPCSDCMGGGARGDDLVALLECKWVAHSWDGWGEPGTDEIPVHYRAQELWQADVLGVSTVYTAALGPTGFRSYVVHVDDAARADLEVMRAAGADFHRRLVEGEVPDLDGHSATLSTLQKLYPFLGEGDVEVPVELAEAYRQARADRDEAKARVAQCEARIRQALGTDFNRAVCNKKLVASRSMFERTSDDTDELHALDDGFPITDRLNPGRATSYAS